jgi:hypothetical protein
MLRFNDEMIKILRNKIILLFLVSTLFSIKQNSILAQVDVRDSCIATPMFTFHYGFQIPGNDMAKRFGINSNLGGSFLFKNKKNWIGGIEFNYIFGNVIKEDTILKMISTSENGIISDQGVYADVKQFERGYYTNIKLGKIFTFNKPNPNSGIMVLASVGFIEHKIRTEVADNMAQQLKGDYKKGYDRLTNGIDISEFIGYIYMGNNRLVSFYAGIEFTQAWTQSRRDWDFDRMAPDKTKRYDTLYGIKIGWIIPLYRKASKGGYYYF